MKLYIDNREPKDIIDIIKSRYENIKLDNLNIGDFIIKNDKDEIIMIFERKSLSDLISSIKDGRYNEQSFRLNDCEINNHNIFYIIEGNIMNFCLKNIIAKNYINNTNTNTNSYISNEITEKNEPCYSSSIKISKKSNITQENIGEIMLAQIPGLSINVAQTIMSNYKTINNLITCLTNDNKCLDKLMIPCKNGERKINKTVVEKILEFLL